MKKTIRQSAALWFLFVCTAVILLPALRVHAKTFYIDYPKEGSTYFVGEELKVSPHGGLQIQTWQEDDYWGNFIPGTADNEKIPLEVRIYEGGALAKTQDCSYKYSPGAVSYTPTHSCTLKIELYAPEYYNPGDGWSWTYNLEKRVLWDTVSVTILDKRDIIKKIKPVITVTRRSGYSIIVNCKNSQGFGMQIYRSDKKNGKYKRIETTTSSSPYIYDSKMKPKQKYYYKVRLFLRQFGKTYYSKWSAIKRK